MKTPTSLAEVMSMMMMVMMMMMMTTMTTTTTTMMMMMMMMMMLLLMMMMKGYNAHRQRPSGKFRRNEWLSSSSSCRTCCTEIQDLWQRQMASSNNNKLFKYLPVYPTLQHYINDTLGKTE